MTEFRIPLRWVIAGILIVAVGVVVCAAVGLTIPF